MHFNSNRRFRINFWLWFPLLVCLVNACSTPSAIPKPENVDRERVLKAIETVATPQETTITVKTLGAQIERKAYTLTAPPRICVDIMGTPTGAFPRKIDMEEGPVEKILVQSREPGHTGVVVYVRPEEYKYGVTLGKDRILLSVTAVGSEKFPARETASEKLDILARPQILGIEVKPLTGNRSRLAIHGNQPLVYETEIEGSDLLIDLKNGFIPSNQLKMLESGPSPGVISRVRGFLDPKGQHVVLRVSLRSLVPYHVVTEGTILFVDFDAFPDKTSDTIGISESTNVPKKQLLAQKKTTSEASRVPIRNGSVKTKIGLNNSGGKTTKQFDNTLRPYAGQECTFEFRNMEIQNFLQLISQVANINIVWGPEVQGKISMSLSSANGVPWDQALEMVLRPNGYTYRIENDVLWVLSVDKLEQLEIEDQERKNKLLEAKRENEALEAKVMAFITIRHRKAEAMYELLKNIMGLSEPSSNLLLMGSRRIIQKSAAVEHEGRKLKDPKNPAGSSGSKEADERKDLFLSFDPGTNMVVANGTRSKVDKVKEFAAKMDIQEKQVLIEARIVEATTGFTRDLGIQWKSLDGGSPGIERKWYDSSGSAFAGSFSTNSPTGWKPNIGLAFGWLTDGGLGSVALDASLALAEEDRKVKIISAPKVLTVNGESAFISRGTEDYFAVATLDQIGYEKIPAVLSLKVIPVISADDARVTMIVEVTDDKAKPQIKTVDPTTGVETESPPGKITKKVTTTLIVNNGETVVIGGIYQEENTSTDTGIPFLMDIPILGWLFKTNKEVEGKVELLIFLTPSVVKGSLTKAL